MSANDTRRYIRRLYIEGRHLNQAMPCADSRQAGWRMMQRARRLARRLGYRNLGCLGIDP